MFRLTRVREFRREAKPLDITSRARYVISVQIQTTVDKFLALPRPVDHFIVDLFIPSSKATLVYRNPFKETRMPRPAPEIISHWHQLYEGLPESPQKIYSLIEEAIKQRQLPGIEMFRIVLHEKGILSAKRDYLRVQTKKHVFDICAAQYGTGFFISWWLTELPAGCLAFLAGVPVIGLLVSWLSPPETYYTYDTALMFQDSIDSAVKEIFNKLTSEKGIRLADLERNPVVGGFLKR